MEYVTSAQVAQLQSEGKKLLVQYTADWCSPCRALTPRLSNLSNKYSDITFVKVNVDENMDASLDMGIRSVPTVMIFDGNKLVDRSQGVQSDTYYKEVLNKL
mgnify:FL=1